MRDRCEPRSEHGICIRMHGYIPTRPRENSAAGGPRSIKEALMRALFAALLVASTLSITACGQRQVEVSTGAQPQSDVVVHFTNNTNSLVNVYVVHGGQRIFIGQVSGNSTQNLPVANVPSGSVVTLEASTVSSSPRTYSRNDVALTGTYTWQVP
jgi:hypothetical protein